MLSKINARIPDMTLYGMLSDVSASPTNI
jgi:hypothetical protein